MTQDNSHAAVDSSTVETTRVETARHSASGASTGNGADVDASSGSILPSARSEEWFRRAVNITPGGVNSPARTFDAVGGTARFIAHGKGSRLFDVDGNE